MALLPWNLAFWATKNLITPKAKWRCPKIMKFQAWPMECCTFSMQYPSRLTSTLTVLSSVNADTTIMISCPLLVNVVQLAVCGMQDIRLSHRNFKAHSSSHHEYRPQPRGRARFCSFSRDHVMASPRNLWRPQVQVEARVSGSSSPHMVLSSLGLGIRDQRALAAVVEGHYEGVLELVKFQWLRADIVQVDSRTSSQGHTEKHNTVPPPAGSGSIISLYLLETCGQGRKLGIHAHLHIIQTMT